MPALYVVATPIGNLEDITLRAVRVLREVKLIAAEDTRKTRRLLTAYNIKTPTTSYYEFNKESKLGYILSILEKDDVALVSEAGTPGMSDPGYELISAAIQRGIPVIPIPGPSTVVTALAVAGLPLERVLFVGFLPPRANSRRKAMAGLAEEPGTIVALESPRRIQGFLKDALAVMGDRRIAVCRELTKLHEEVFRGCISRAIEHFQQPRGEFTLVIGGSKEEKKPVVTEEIERKLGSMRTSGMAAREAVGLLSEESGLSRRELYRLWLSLTGAPDKTKK